MLWLVWNPALETLPWQQLSELQFRKLKRIVQWAYERCPFYTEKFDRVRFHPDQLGCRQDLERIPMTGKDEWLEGQGDNPVDYGRMIAVPDAEIVRYHQTSGTTGRPIRLAFSHRDWLMWLQCWGYGLSACDLTAGDRVLVCFPFNLFVGWWGGQDAARLLGCRVYSGGGMSSEQRIEVIRQQEITVLMGAPSYLLRLAQVGRDHLGLDTAALRVKTLVCGAEPGGSIPATRRRLEEAWGADVFDHLGASEVGPWGYECASHPGGVHVCESYFLMEFLDPKTFEPAAPGELSRIVITSLEKFAQPVIRWDLKDLVRPAVEACPCGRSFRWVRGGILGRADDLIKIRGVLFSLLAVEDIVRSFADITEYRVKITRHDELDELTLEAETAVRAGEAAGLEKELLAALKLKTHLRFTIALCPPETLPRAEIKTRRVLDLRESGDN